MISAFDKMNFSWVSILQLFGNGNKYGNKYLRVENQNKNKKRVYPECLSFENEMRVSQMSDVNEYGFVKSRLWKSKSKLGTRLLLDFCQKVDFKVDFTRL